MQDSTYELEVRMNLEAAIAGISPEHGDTDESPEAAEYDRLRHLGPAALEAELAPGAESLIERIELRVDGQRAALELIGVDIPEVGDTAIARNTRLLLAGELPAGAGSFTWQVDQSLGQSVIRLRAGELIASSAFVEAGQIAGPITLGDAAPRGFAEAVTQYIGVGFVHIIPAGLDHILFVIGLFLLSPRLSSLLWQVSAFTVAHTVTLALGVTGVVTIAPSVVEPLIAASIVYVAVENLFTDRLHRWRIAVVFGFGLLHGLGFAGVLGEFGLPAGDFVAALLAFNVGVELGQLAVVCACYALVWPVKERTWYRTAVVVPGSVAIGLMALFWVAERTGLL